MLESLSTQLKSDDLYYVDQYKTEHHMYQVTMFSIESASRYMHSVT